MLNFEDIDEVVMFGHCMPVKTMVVKLLIMVQCGMSIVWECKW